MTRKAKPSLTPMIERLIRLEVERRAGWLDRLRLAIRLAKAHPGRVVKVRRPVNHDWQSYERALASGIITRPTPRRAHHA